MPELTKIVYFGHDRDFYGTEKIRKIEEKVRAKYPNCLIINPEEIVQNSLTVMRCLEQIERASIVVFVPVVEANYGYTLHRGQATELLLALSLNKDIDIFYP